MITAGFVNALVTLSWTTNDVTFSLGQALDLVPPVLFLHVFLAFPTGRLKTRFERVLVIVAYVTAITLQLVRMAFGGFGANNLLEVTANPGAALMAVRVQLLAVSAFCLAGVGILIARRLRTGRPLRRSRALLVDAFALGLVMIAALFLSHVLRRSRASAASLGDVRSTRARADRVPDRPPSRPARTLVRRRPPAPAADRSGAGGAPGRARTRPSRSVTDARRTGCPTSRATSISTEGHVKLPTADRRRATTLIDRDGARVAALMHDPRAQDDEPELLDAVTAAAGIALENGRASTPS